MNNFSIVNSNMFQDRFALHSSVKHIHHHR